MHQVELFLDKVMAIIPPWFIWSFILWVFSHGIPLYITCWCQRASEASTVEIYSLLTHSQTANRSTIPLLNTRIKLLLFSFPWFQVCVLCDVCCSIALLLNCIQILAMTVNCTSFRAGVVRMVKSCTKSSVSIPPLLFGYNLILCAVLKRKTFECESSCL